VFLHYQMTYKVTLILINNSTDQKFVCKIREITVYVSIDFSGVSLSESNLHYVLKYNYFCTTNQTGPIVQWIEFQIPVLTIWVRIPMGSQINTDYQRIKNVLNHF
jgi:hypothetical protein